MMELWVKDRDGRIVAVYMDGKLTMHIPADKNLLAFELFGLLVQMMSIGGGASYGGPLGQPSQEAVPDFDFGTPTE